MNTQATSEATRSVASEPSEAPVRVQPVVGGLAEIFERAKGAVTEHCRTGMKPVGRSEMYRDMMHGVLDQLRAHCEKPSNAAMSDGAGGKLES